MRLILILMVAMCLVGCKETKQLIVRTQTAQTDSTAAVAVHVAQTTDTTRTVEVREENERETITEVTTVLEYDTAAETETPKLKRETRTEKVSVREKQSGNVLNTQAGVSEINTDTTTNTEIHREAENVDKQEAQQSTVKETVRQAKQTVIWIVVLAVLVIIAILLLRKVKWQSVVEKVKGIFSRKD